MSDESGRPEVYVQPYPGPGGKRQISIDGGHRTDVEPRTARELFYRLGTQFIAVPVGPQPTFSAGKPVTLFEADYAASEFPLTSPGYDVSMTASASWSPRMLNPLLRRSTSSSTGSKK